MLFRSGGQRHIGLFRELLKSTTPETRSYVAAKFVSSCDQPVPEKDRDAVVALTKELVMDEQFEVAYWASSMLTPEKTGGNLNGEILPVIVERLRNESDLKRFVMLSTGIQANLQRVVDNDSFLKQYAEGVLDPAYTPEQNRELAIKHRQRLQAIFDSWVHEAKLKMKAK